ncbi:MAG: hypothetical protein R2785_05280 [Flavobacteriaceae bacterium]
MKKINKSAFLLLSFFVLLLNCKNEAKSEPESEPIVENTAKVIDIVTLSMEFQMPDTIPSGWNTIKYSNKANETHFYRFIKLPEGINIDIYKKEVDPVFEEGMDLINEGKTEEGFAAFGKLPEWFNKGVPSGGSGLIAPKSEALNTLYLNSGLYIVECYVKMPNGRFHSTMGMIKQVYVSDAKNEIEPPVTTNTIEIKEDGFHISGDLKKGEHVFEVNVVNQKLHENFATSDVHLVKLESIADTNALEAWMVWYDPKGFITPVPNGVKFLGGFNDAIEGSKGYFYADLKPGKYALIAEVPNAREKGLFKQFTVN